MLRRSLHIKYFAPITVRAASLSQLNKTIYRTRAYYHTHAVYARAHAVPRALGTRQLVAPILTNAKSPEKVTSYDAA